MDAAAEPLDLAVCGATTWVGMWFDEAQSYLDAQVEATKPTGDFVTNVQAACDRLYVDLADAPLPLSGVDTQLWALSLRDALGLFIRDVAALAVPEGKQQAVDELMATIDDLNVNLGKLVSAVPSGTSDPDALIGSIQQGIDDLQTGVDGLGASC